MYHIWTCSFHAFCSTPDISDGYLDFRKRIIKGFLSILIVDIPLEDKPAQVIIVQISNLLVGLHFINFVWLICHNFINNIFCLNTLIIEKHCPLGSTREIDNWLTLHSIGRYLYQLFVVGIYVSTYLGTNWLM